MTDRVQRLINHRGLKCSRPFDVSHKKKIDWKKIYQVYDSHNYIEDIERARLYLESKGLIKSNKLTVWGRSGGGLLGQQYLERYSKNVKRAVLERFAIGLKDIKTEGLYPAFLQSVAAYKEKGAHWQLFKITICDLKQCHMTTKNIIPSERIESMIYLSIQDSI